MLLHFADETLKNLLLPRARILRLRFFLLDHYRQHSIIQNLYVRLQHRNRKRMIWLLQSRFSRTIDPDKFSRFLFCKSEAVSILQTFIKRHYLSRLFRSRHKVCSGSYHKSTKVIIDGKDFKNHSRDYNAKHIRTQDIFLQRNPYMHLPLQRKQHDRHSRLNGKVVLRQLFHRLQRRSVDVIR